MVVKSKFLWTPNLKYFKFYVTQPIIELEGWSFFELKLIYKLCGASDS